MDAGRRLVQTLQSDSTHCIGNYNLSVLSLVSVHLLVCTSLERIIRQWVHTEVLLANIGLAGIVWATISWCLEFDMFILRVREVEVLHEIALKQSIEAPAEF